MHKPKYPLGGTIPGTIGKIIGIVYSHDHHWVYTIQFDEGLLTIGENDIQRSIIEVLNQPTMESDG